MKFVDTSSVSIEAVLRAKILMLARMGVEGAFIAKITKKDMINELALQVATEVIHPLINNNADRQSCLRQVRSHFI